MDFKLDAGMVVLLKEFANLGRGYYFLVKNVDDTLFGLYFNYDSEEISGGQYDFGNHICLEEIERVWKPEITGSLKGILKNCHINSLVFNAEDYAKEIIVDNKKFYVKVGKIKEIMKIINE